MVVKNVNVKLFKSHGKALSLNSVGHYQEILKALSDNMQTNIDLSAKVS